MDELKFTSKDDVMYKGIIQDVIELTKKQRAKLKILASNMTSKEIEEKGLELTPEDWQERAILEKIRKTLGRENGLKESIVDLIKRILQERKVLLTDHAERDRLPDPTRNCATIEDAIERLINVGKVQKFKANVTPHTKELRKKLSYTVGNQLGNGKLAIKFSEDKLIIIITILS